MLVYARREDSPWHDPAFKNTTELAEQKSLWAIPWRCIHEFLALVSHPRIHSPPTPLAAAINQIEAWFESPSLVLLAETEGYWPELRAALEQGRIHGPQIHDARIAAICRYHGVRELWTADRDFTRLPETQGRQSARGVSCVTPTGRILSHPRPVLYDGHPYF